MSDLVQRRLVHLPSPILRELASLAEAREAADNPWRHLPDRAVDEALEMITRGAIPGLGWWRRHLPKPEVKDDWPPMPPPIPPREWEPWELVCSAIAMSDDGVERDTAFDVLAHLAADHGLGAEALADSYIAFEGEP